VVNEEHMQSFMSRLTLWCPLLLYRYSYKASCASQTGLSRHL